MFGLNLSVGLLSWVCWCGLDLRNICYNIGFRALKVGVLVAELEF